MSESEFHEAIWQNVCEVALDTSIENYLEFTVYQGNKEQKWGLIRDSDTKKIIGVSLPYRDFMEVEFNTVSSQPTIYFYRPKDGRSGIKERLEFSPNSISLRYNAKPWDFSEWKLDQVFRF